VEGGNNLITSRRSVVFRGVLKQSMGGAGLSRAKDPQGILEKKFFELMK